MRERGEGGSLRDAPTASTQTDPDPTAFPSDDWAEHPVTGTFHTSWRAALTGTTAWATVVVVGVMGVIAWMDGDPLFFWLGLILALVWVLFDAAMYGLRGAEWVQITSEALSVTRRGRRPETVRWADLRDAHFRSSWPGERWVLRHGHERTVVPEYGFTSDDWLSIRGGISCLQASGPLRSLPGVESAPSRERSEATAFVPRHPAALFWAIPFFLLVGLLPFLFDGLEPYRDGTWTEDLETYVAMPAIGFGFVVLGLWALSRMARRVVFEPQGLRVERFFRAPARIPYADITDAWGQTVRTRHGSFSIGNRNAESFHRLLAERLENSQLSGEMGAYTLAEVSSRWLYVVMFAPPVLAIALTWWLRLGEGAGVALMAMLYVAFGVPYTLWSRRRARRWLAEERQDENT